MKKVKCSQCLVEFAENSEQYYWHLKIHNAKLEEAILYRQFNREVNPNK